MKSYHHFTPEDREKLQVMLALGKSMREIARQLGRAASSVSREIHRNKKAHGDYSAYTAVKKYAARRKGRTSILPGNAPFLEWLQQKLALKWSVEAAVFRFKKENPHQRCPSVSTVYRGFRNGILPSSLRQQLKRKGKKPGAYRTANNGKLLVEHTIHERPALVEDRARLGDWESDTVRGFKHKSGILTHVDRKSRFLVAEVLLDTTACTCTSAMIESLRPLPAHTVTVDRGMEFSRWRLLERQLGVTVYFCDPHSPWQRGTNENTNGLLRQYFPKGFDFRTISHAELQAVVALINHRPRKCLGWLSPFEVFFAPCCT